MFSENKAEQNNCEPSTLEIFEKFAESLKQKHKFQSLTFSKIVWTFVILHIVTYMEMNIKRILNIATQLVHRVVIPKCHN